MSRTVDITELQGYGTPSSGLNLGLIGLVGLCIEVWIAIAMVVAGLT